MIWTKYVVPISQLLWKYGLKYICIVVGSLLLIASFPVVIAVIIACIPIGIALIPVAIVAYVVGSALWYIGKVCSPLCCFYIIRRVERKAEREVEMQNLEAKRRREETVARTERFFEDLEKGVPIADLQEANALEVETQEIEAEDRTTVKANCFLDTHLSGGRMKDVVFFPVIQRESLVSGLLLRPVNNTVDHYERLGVFEASQQQLMKLHHPTKDEIILLV